MIAVALAVSLSLAAGKEPALVGSKVNGLELKVPRGWSHSAEEGTQRWEAPGGGQSLSLDVFPVQGDPLEAEVCVDKLVAALGGEKWERIVVGGSPAARRVFQDELEDGRKVETHSHVGCDGRTKWALTLVTDQKRRKELPVKKVVESIRYGARK